MTTLATFRALVRQDLHDEDSAAYRWTDAVLDRHIGRALADYSIAAPLEQRATIAATPGSRDLSVASLTGLVAIEGVEWPVGEFPPARVGFSLWQTTLTMDVVAAPSSAQNVYVYWTTVHALGASSTIPIAHENIVAEGAAGYAALDWTTYASNRLNTGGDDVWGRYQAFAQERLRQFRADLARLGRANTVRQRRMYTTDAPSVFEQNRVKY